MRRAAGQLETNLNPALIRNGSISSIKEIVHNLNNAKLDPDVGTWHLN